MLESAFYFRMAFTHLEVSDSNYKGCPTKDEWEKIEKLSKFLAVFYDITRVFSRTKYPAANLYFPFVFWARLTLEQHMKGDDVLLRNMAKLMLDKFDKYWSEFSLILVIAVILDPRYKLQSIDWSYKKLYRKDSVEFKLVKDSLNTLYNEYAVSLNANISVKESSSVGSYDQVGNAMDVSASQNDVWKEFDFFDVEYGASVRKSQLQQYLDEPRVEKTREIIYFAILDGKSVSIS